MTEIADLKAAVAGTGFVGVVHVDALRRLGIDMLGVAGSTRERAAAKGIAPPSTRSRRWSPTSRSTSSTSRPQPPALRAGRAGARGREARRLREAARRHVGAVGELLELAERAGVVHCTNFNLRFYPLVHEARERVRDGEIGDVWNVHGGYLQDWLAQPTDWNWRLEPEKAGELRAVGDIGSHWLDLMQFVTGLRIVEVLADLATVIPVRERPRGEVETFAGGEDVEREPVSVATEDVAHILLRFENGARGSLVVSQVSNGRKNSLRFEVDGSRGRARLGLRAARGALAREPRPRRTRRCSGTPR